MGLFSNGSAFAQAQQRPTAQQSGQAPDVYWNQTFANQSRAEQDLQRDIARDQLLQRGYELAGFVQRDRRSENRGFVWERARSATWPAQMPEPARAAVEQAISADRQARTALDSAILEFNLWLQAHPTASEELRRVEYERASIDPITVAQHTAQQLQQALATAAAIVETIEQWQAVERTVDQRKDAENRRHEQALAAIDSDVMIKRQAAQRAGVRV